MTLSVHEIPIAELRDMIASDPQTEDGGFDCVVCGAPFSIDADLEPTAACNPCSQTAAIRLANHVEHLNDGLNKCQRVILHARRVNALNATRRKHARASQAEIDMAKALRDLDGE